MLLSIIIMLKGKLFSEGNIADEFYAGYNNTTWLPIEYESFLV